MYTGNWKYFYDFYIYKCFICTHIFFYIWGCANLGKMEAALT